MPFKTGSIAGLCGEFQKNGADEGGSNRPNSNSVAPDLNEVKAITMARQAVTSEETALANSMVMADKQSSEIEQRVVALDAECKSHSSHDLVEGAFLSVLAKHDHALVSTCADEMTTRAALNGFRFRNGIKDPASYPPDILYHFSLLILFVVIETGVNAFFYESSKGLLGGAAIALSISVVNMGVAALLGSLFRYANLPETKYKCIGYASLFGFLTAGFLLNLLFATFRGQYLLLVDSNLTDIGFYQQTEALKAAGMEVLRVFTLNFPAIDIQSFILFFLGFGCSVIAFWKGYKFDDKYPGHGDYDRRHKAAEKTFVEAKDSVFEEAVSSVTRTVQEVVALRSSILSEQRQAAALKAQVLAARTSFDHAVQIIQHELNLVIDTYRAANRATRATAEPVYFRDQIRVIPESVDSDRLDHLLKKIDAALTQAKVLADTHGMVLGERLLRIQRQTNSLVANEFQKHLDEVKLRAQNLFSSRQSS